MRNYNLLADKAFMKNFVGIDKVFDQYFDLVGDFKNIQYPPYNVFKNEKGDYFLEVAVAGFSASDIDVEIHDKLLTVKGSKPKQEDQGLTYYHKGIGTRDFLLKFFVPEDCQILGAKLEDGMLQIHIEHVIPESRRAKKIPLTTISSANLVLENK